MFWAWFLILTLGAAALTAAAIAPLRAWLRARAILDLPNDRSSHSVPTPRGAGIAVVAVAVAGGAAAILLTAGHFDTGPAGLAQNGPGILLLTALLAALFWWDDRSGLPAAPRLLAQALACAAGLFCLPHAGFTFQGLLPVWADLALTWFVWLWFVNLYNFMDGIDGITAVETLTIAGGSVLAAGLGATLLGPNLLSGPFLTEGPRLLLMLGAVAGAASGFLLWNRPPARIFLGDSGSVPLGFLLGWVLILLAGNGHWVAALILPLYHLADSSLTIALRLLRGARIWQAHRQHFYQQGARRFGGHARVLARLLPLNLALVALAALSVAWPAAALPALAAAALLVAAAMWHFAERGPARRAAGGAVGR